MHLSARERELERSVTLITLGNEATEECDAQTADRASEASHTDKTGAAEEALADTHSASSARASAGEGEMRNSSLDLPLTTTTKVGAGDKERAYVVRQNTCLKALLAVICTLGTLSTVLVYTRYEVSVQRRISIQGAKNHREEEHASHMRVMRLSMLLQRHLEDEVHDANVLTTYRAWLMRAVGDYQMHVMDKSSNCSHAERSALQAEGVHFDAEIEKLLKLLWDDVVKEGKQAQKQLHNITHAIVAELRQDATEQGEYERVMEEAGEDAGLLGYHNHEVEYRGHLEGDPAERHHHRHHHRHDLGEGGGEGGEPWAHEGGEHDADGHPHEGGEHEGGEHHGDGVDEHGGEHHGDPYHEPDDDDEEHLAGALEALLSKLRHNESVLVGVSNATLASWTKLHESSLNALADQEQEVDLERVNKKILAAVDESHVPGVPAYNATAHGSELDFLQDIVRKARLAPHRHELLELLESWQSGNARISEPLNLIEQLIDEEVLDPDVLIIHGDYEHYRYD